MLTLLTLENVKNQFYTMLASDNTLVMSLEQYIQKHFECVYDAELNFIGYELGSN